jgi:predicted pyridoxine 5'-phosphate oxidase superfamily flavin-nucleotide-binding protein
MGAGPFHRGELEAQRLAGVGAAGGGIRPFLTEQLREFFRDLPFVVVGALDGDQPLATVLTGAPGFIASPDAATLAIATPIDRSDPAQRAIVPGAAVGLIGIDLATRRRNRANGVVRASDERGYVLGVEQAFGNCPSYIHQRKVKLEVAHAPVETFSRLDEVARSAIAAADTFFVATASREQKGGVDVSHRGGPPGFVHVDGDTLTIPDYRGNRYFNTFGNLVLNPRAALLFIDFATGELLEVHGTTEIVWDGPELHQFLAAERLWRVHVEGGWRRPAR